MNWQLLKDYSTQVFIGFDQFLNTLIPPLDGTVSYADETLSARCYRAHRAVKWVMAAVWGAAGLLALFVAKQLGLV